MRFITACAAMTIFFSAGLSASPLIEQLIGVTNEFLEREVENYLSRSTREARYQIEVSRLDPRLRLPQCPAEDMRASLESPSVPVGRVTVRVACEGEVRWRLFVPAQVSLHQQVLVATRPLGRNAVIGPQDVALMERDVGSLGDSYFTDPAAAIGMRVRRPLNADAVVSANQLEQDEVVRRGDKVVISSGNSQISVRMPGEALESGVIGSQIRVRNTHSGRTVVARITAPGQVSVAM
ncbi:flagellar basal body P-ring formation chaperone FlgA [Pseudomonas sp.]|uniref:flagellar basal body P-ring formation chaperone FlgA n=1 Tax=Pseudomonas sp. TaxID=306 RepID=UPI00272B9B98|nr:flagellar basal body P-ring formation chaperone FlgA [Pseudomonas sp.]